MMNMKAPATAPAWAGGKKTTPPQAMHPMTAGPMGTPVPPPAPDAEKVAPQDAAIITAAAKSDPVIAAIARALGISA